MKEDKILIGQIEDKIRKCEDQYIPTSTGFLDTHQQSLARGVIRAMGKTETIKIYFYGGFDDAERVVMLCLPDYADFQEEDPLTLIRATKAEGAGTLGHGDYLGSLTGLGIKREKIGDILVRDNGADIIVVNEIAEYLMLNYGKAGRTYLTLTKHPIDQLEIPENKKTILSDTVASLRIDNIVSSAFGISRAKASQAINSGLVSVNHIEITKIDMQVSQGDIIVLRRKGKVCLKEVGGVSRKGRQYVTYIKY